MHKTPRQCRGVFFPGEAESIVDSAAALIVRHPIAVPGLLSAMQLAARLSDRGITTEHVTLAVDEWLAKAKESKQVTEKENPIDARENQTLHGAMYECRDACRNFVLEFAYSLGIHHACSWLTHTIEWCKRKIAR